MSEKRQESITRGDTGATFRVQRCQFSPPEIGQDKQNRVRACPGTRLGRSWYSFFEA